MSEGNTDNVNVLEQNNTYTDNDTVSKYERSKRVEIIAQKLVEKFGTAKWFPFYCKVAWKLSEEQIWRFYEHANGKKVRNPAKLFYYLCDRAMRP